MTNVPGFEIMDKISPEQSTLNGTLATDIVEESFVHYSQCPSLELGDLSGLDDADVAFLTAKQSLHIPPHNLIDDFLRQFFMEIQPYMPLMDESLFWSIYENQSTDGQPRRIPLLLFQAMLFAGSPYVSIRTVKMCGFKDKRTAWTTLYQRAKVRTVTPLPAPGVWTDTDSRFCTIHQLKSI